MEEKRGEGALAVVHKPTSAFKRAPAKGRRREREREREGGGRAESDFFEAHVPSPCDRNAAAGSPQPRQPSSPCSPTMRAGEDDNRDDGDVSCRELLSGLQSLH